MLKKKQYGGLGIQKPSVVYKATRISFLVNMLNYENQNIQYVARNSLGLYFAERGAGPSVDDRNFSGFKTNASGHLETNVKCGFGVQSDWPQLCYLVEKVGVKLHWEKSGENDIIEAGHAQVIIGSENVKIVTGKLIRKDILEKRLSDDLEDMESLPMQGAFVDIKNADYLLSQNIFRNFRISAISISFWYKSRHNVIPCHYTLSLWYPEHSPGCRLDGYRLESISHVLR